MLTLHPGAAKFVPIEVRNEDGELRDLTGEALKLAVYVDEVEVFSVSTPAGIVIRNQVTDPGVADARLESVDTALLSPGDKAAFAVILTNSGGDPDVIAVGRVDVRWPPVS